MAKYVNTVSQIFRELTEIVPRKLEMAPNGMFQQLTDKTKKKQDTLLSGDAHARRPLHKMDGVFFFFRFVGQLLEHPVWRHLQLPAH